MHNIIQTLRKHFVWTSESRPTSSTRNVRSTNRREPNFVGFFEFFLQRLSALPNRHIFSEKALNFPTKIVKFPLEIVKFSWKNRKISLQIQSNFSVKIINFPHKSCQNFPAKLSNFLANIVKFLYKNCKIFLQRLSILSTKIVAFSRKKD